MLIEFRSVSLAGGTCIMVRVLWTQQLHWTAVKTSWLGLVLDQYIHGNVWGRERPGCSGDRFNDCKCRHIDSATWRYPPDTCRAVFWEAKRKFVFGGNWLGSKTQPVFSMDGNFSPYGLYFSLAYQFYSTVCNLANDFSDIQHLKHQVPWRLNSLGGSREQNSSVD